jgi:hypothetical protein
MVDAGWLRLQAPGAMGIAGGDNTTLLVTETGVLSSFVDLLGITFTGRPEGSPFIVNGQVWAAGTNATASRLP